jgi:glycosyltransferase 2 family protein
MRYRKGMIVLAPALLLVLAVVANRGRIHFDWGAFWLQVRHIRWVRIAIAVALIYSTYWLRALRWAVLLSAQKKVSASALLPPQFIGFTAVALFGRMADVIRPALVARRIGLPVSTQFAVYTVERMFDLGAAAIIFSGALLFLPRDLPHHEIFVRTGAVSLAGTAFLAIFAVVLRLSGAAVAAFVRHVLGGLSQSIANSVADKIQDFREGLNTLASTRDLFVTVLISLAMWIMIGFAYVETLHAFADTPQLATLGFSRTMLLMAASIGGSLLQLPVIGWFTQIAVTATAMHEFYDAPVEVSTACGAILLAVTFLSIIPAGLLCARIERVSLRALPQTDPAAHIVEIARPGAPTA